ncbi:hypothetical protein AR457_26690 [Streptomyces agglomeratus]|uniref:Nucleopolyhedrovirus P10 family protein n=1 Tax=Streptomyces agglomeratus TaxID=285458 RepID=A0A1E5PDA3_9ACTN|nr:hypothetical protein [Streptomyces agglomeratus]OEJ27519.1 hypothetical protein AS594_26565 [Streptomyces agglomeratus]OEJ38423.1 hypothetical protein BGK70_09965 [Streptomyces agglomeratus]OEJ47192.1 hypothetical protein AR457_26690 [Streptomyces agglomeratus]OEJ50951.1 hypothetical protein BGK72_09450 [Streptomyces agglomeratus]OEJ58321.1 hypothetical protein BGM19_10360 [Streptomyces agglomeratus]
MAPDGMTRAVRQLLGLGRLLPLGEAADGAWLAEKAADSVLRRAAAAVPGVKLGSLRIGLTDPDAAVEPAVPPPPGALPPGPLRIQADLTADTGGEPLPHRAERLRIALREAASARLGLAVTAVDLRVTDLVEAGQEPVPATPPDEGHGGRDEEAVGEGSARPDEQPDQQPGGEPGEPETAPEGGAGGPDTGDTARRAAAAAAATAVPGVARLTHVLGAPVRLRDDHVQIELATAPGHRALAVAVAVRRAVAASQEGRPTVAVLVTDVE